MLGLRLRVHRYVAVSNIRSLRTRATALPTSPTLPKSPTSQPKPVIPEQLPKSRTPRSRPVVTEEERQKKRREKFLRNKKLIGYTLTCLIGFEVVQLAIAVWKASDDDGEARDISQQKDVVERYDEIADNFDSDLYVSELMMGVLGMRKSIAKACTGNVLEVSCGTGRNLGYYALFGKVTEVKSLTLIDISPAMVQVCKRKFLALNGTQQSKRMNPITIRFITGSALEEMPLAPDGNKYDAIVQTMGLCSTPAPVELVVNMARHLDLSNPDARIYLLEHGRSHYDWLNKILNHGARKHADIYGCWNNRELGDLVKAAAAEAGLEIVREKRRHAGTTYLYELKAGPDAAKKLQKQVTLTQSTEPAQDTWRKWFSKVVNV